MPPLTVDCQTHVFPEAYAELLKRNTTSARVTGGRGEYVIRYGDLQQFTLRTEDYDLPRKLRDMDEAGVDVSVLSVNIPGPDQLAPELAVEAARLINDCLADACDRHPGRFAGLASLPLQEAPAALAELDRAVDHLKLRGVLVGSSLDGRPIDSPELEPFYARAEEKQMPLVLHPVVSPWHTAVRDYAMIPMLGFMADTSIAMLRLILGGVMERHPRLQVVHPHAGGVLPYLLGRIEEQTEVKRRGREHLRRPPGEYYRRVYLDTATPSAQTLRFACDLAGADHMLMGSDHPWIKIGTMVDLIARLGLSQSDKDKIMGVNAGRLFKIDH
jgi:predicted TIM-barrel fold metal-dependent hydrolase